MSVESWESIDKKEGGDARRTGWLVIYIMPGQHCAAGSARKMSTLISCSRISI